MGGFNCLAIGAFSGGQELRIVNDLDSMRPTIHVENSISLSNFDFVLYPLSQRNSLSHHIIKRMSDAQS